jgi:hypothetical protein
MMSIQVDNSGSGEDRVVKINPELKKITATVGPLKPGAAVVSCTLESSH